MRGSRQGEGLRGMQRALTCSQSLLLALLSSSPPARQAGKTPSCAIGTANLSFSFSKPVSIRIFVTAECRPIFLIWVTTRYKMLHLLLSSSSQLGFSSSLGTENHFSDSHFYYSKRLHLDFTNRKQTMFSVIQRTDFTPKLIPYSTQKIYRLDGVEVREHGDVLKQQKNFFLGAIQVSSLDSTGSIQSYYKTHSFAYR